MTLNEISIERESPKILNAIRFVELNYPETANYLKRLWGNGLLYALFCVKQMDYGPENIRGGNNLETRFGRVMSIREVGRRVGDKVSRIANITLREIKREGAEDMFSRLHDELDQPTIEKAKHYIENYAAANESLEDSLMDITIYGAIALMVSDGVWGK